jgi:hypothetical protein
MILKGTISEADDQFVIVVSMGLWRVLLVHQGRRLPTMLYCTPHVAEPEVEARRSLFTLLLPLLYSSQQHTSTATADDPGTNHSNGFSQRTSILGYPTTRPQSCLVVSVHMVVKGM